MGYDIQKLPHYVSGGPRPPFKIKKCSSKCFFSFYNARKKIPHTLHLKGPLMGPAPYSISNDVYQYGSLVSTMLKYFFNTLATVSLSNHLTVNFTNMIFKCLSKSVCQHHLLKELKFCRSIDLWIDG